jgi:hypothetical protein
MGICHSPAAAEVDAMNALEARGGVMRNVAEGVA